MRTLLIASFLCAIALWLLQSKKIAVFEPSMPGEKIEQLLYSKRFAFLDATPKNSYLFNQIEVDETAYHLSLRGDSTLIEYELHLDTTRMSVMWKNGKKLDVPFSLVDSHVHVLNGEWIVIHKFARNYYASDGCVTLFWAKELGLLLERNPVWRDFGLYLSVNDSKKREQQILTITSMIGLEDFAAKCGAH